jgi:hypothetical protein
VPSEDYSRWPPCCADFFPKGRKTDTEQQTREKKTMKTHPQHNQKKGLLSQPEQLGTGRRPLIDFVRRRVHRLLPADALLALLRKNAPEFFERAEVIGKWVWIQFEGRQSFETTRRLAEFGFHWNGVRQAWQHPCGTFVLTATVYDPRKRYGSYFPADLKAS